MIARESYLSREPAKLHAESMTASNGQQSRVVCDAVGELCRRESAPEIIEKNYSRTILRLFNAP